MLNLEELERKLDVALDNEDAQSLTDWLLNLRKDNLTTDNYINFLGSGCIEPIKAPKFYDAGIKVSSNTNNLDTNTNAAENNYSLAA